MSLDTLESRRGQICLKFAKKAAKHPKHQQWFKTNTMNVNTRQEKTKYCKVAARTNRYMKSPISYLTTLLNSEK